jgi:uncharacterized membrane protein YeaQ/YmgE (transglycosylase-associated protein family)
VIGTIIGLIVMGLVVGVLARLISPGRDPMSLLATIGIGIGSTLLVGLLVEHGILRWILAIIVAVGLVSLYETFVGRGRRRGVLGRA